MQTKRVWYPTKWIKIVESHGEIIDYKYEMYYFVPSYVIFSWAKRWMWVRAEYVYSNTRLNKSKAQLKLIRDRQNAIYSKKYLRR